MYENMDKFFTLKLQLFRADLKRPLIVVNAWDATRNTSDIQTGHSPIEIEVRHGGKVIFPRGSLRCAVNAWTCTDGIEAKELVLAAVAMKPGDTDSDYFKDYTPDQLAWVEKFGEGISMERDTRYCDPETGEVKS